MVLANLNTTNRCKRTDRRRAALFLRMLDNGQVVQMLHGALGEHDQIKSLAIVVRVVATKQCPFTIEQCLDLIDTTMSTKPK
jgi:hypothetical protein